MNWLVGLDYEPIIKCMIAHTELPDGLLVMSLSPENVGVHDFRNHRRNTNHVRCDNTRHDLLIGDGCAVAREKIEPHFYMYAFLPEHTSFNFFHEGARGTL